MAEFTITLSSLGAVPDARELRDAEMAASSTTLTSASAAFVEADVGKPIVIGGAGASDVKLVTTIASFVSTTEVAVANTAETAVSGAGAVYGTDCSAALQAGFDALAASMGGTMVIDGLFLLASPVAKEFGGETVSITATVIGSGMESGIWIGTADGADAISLTSAGLEFRELNFLGVPGASRDCRRVMNLSALVASFERCGFYGLMAQDAVIYASNCYIDTRECMFGGSFVGSASGYTNAVIENKNWVAYRDDYSQFIDYGYFQGRIYSKSGIGQNLGWVRADTAIGTDGARGEGVFRMRGTRVDEGSLYGIVVKPTTGTVAHVHFQGLRQNVTPAESGRGVHCQKVESVVMEQCWLGWATSPALIGHFQDCGTVLLDSLKLSDSVNSLSAVNVTSLTLKDTAGVTTFSFTKVNFHPVTSRYADVSLVKDGAIADADFVSPPALGTLGFDRTHNRLYLKRVTTEGWVYFDMSGGDPFGPELVVNGMFGSGTTGWTAANSGVLSVVDGALRITNGAVYGRAYQGVPTVAGQQYQVSVAIVGGTAGRLVRIGTGQGEGTFATLTGTGGIATFTATTATTYITLMLDNEQAGKYADFDDASLRAI